MRKQTVMSLEEDFREMGLMQEIDDGRFRRKFIRKGISSFANFVTGANVNRINHDGEKEQMEALMKSARSVGVSVPNQAGLHKALDSASVEDQIKILKEFCKIMDIDEEEIFRNSHIDLILLKLF